MYTQLLEHMCSQNCSQQVGTAPTVGGGAEGGLPTQQRSSQSWKECCSTEPGEYTFSHRRPHGLRFHVYKTSEQGGCRETAKGVMATGRDIFLGRENVLKLTVVMSAQLCACTEPNKFEWCCGVQTAASQSHKREASE